MGVSQAEAPVESSDKRRKQEEEVSPVGGGDWGKRKPIDGATEDSEDEVLSLS